MEHAGSVAGWIHQVAGQIHSISLPVLLLALGLHTCEMLLNALAWRNICAVRTRAPMFPTG